MQLKTLEIKYKSDSLDLSFYELIGKKDGPHIFISGGIHGNEINGVELVKKFIHQAKIIQLEKELKGRITIFPILNPTGFETGIRYVGIDGKDLNRQFGFKSTSFSSHLADVLSNEFFRKCDLGIDCHDSGGSVVLIPHVRIHKSDKFQCMSCTRELAQSFGTRVIMERKGHPNMMAVSLFKNYGTPVITVELGGNQIIYEDFLRFGLQGIKNVLITQGMISGKAKVHKRQYFLYGRYGIKATRAGIVKIDTKLGQMVHAGEKLGNIYYPTTQSSESLISPMCGIMLSKRVNNQVTAGGSLYSILEHKQCHVIRTTLDKFEEMPGFSVKQVNL
jgi:predicted deacylase